MPLEIIRNDITRVKADAIVNTANPEVAYGPSVDSAIYAAAGAEELLKERAKIGRMSPGEVAITPAFKLDAKYIIHTVGPAWIDGSHGEEGIVATCYRRSLELAKENECESIAFPLISTGTYQFPKDKALKIAISEISSFLFDNEMLIYLVVYDTEAFVLSSKLFSDVAEYIKDSEVAANKRKFLGAVSHHSRRESRFGSAKRNEDSTIDDILIGSAMSGVALYEELSADKESLEDVLRNKGETFQERLFRIIDKKGLDDVAVYKKANIDRKLFSKIKSNRNYNPSKKTVLAFAIALELSLDETLDLLKSAGMTFTESNIFDIIIEYCIDHKIFDIYEINCILFKYGQPILGA